nr:hypothetical protein [Tanacetum cinerariifolium]
MGFRENASWVKRHRHMVLLGEGVGTVWVSAGVREVACGRDGVIVNFGEKGPSGELDGKPTLSDGQDKTKTVETN